MSSVKYIRSLISLIYYEKGGRILAIVTTYQRAFNTRRLDPYPVDILKRVDRPTTLIKDDEVKRVDERESGFNRAGERGNNIPK